MEERSDIIDTDDVVSEDTHGPHEHEHESFSSLDRGYGKSVAAGYAGGMLVIFAFMLVVLNRAVGDTMSFGGQALAAAAVAFWIGIMGGVVAVGMWAMKHEEELFH
jgi:hypothetical protein